MAYTGKNRPTGAALSPKRIMELERVAAAIELRKRGKTFQEIADVCGWAGRNGAYLAIERELLKRISEPVAAVIQLELDRLDALLDGLWDQAIGQPAHTLDQDTLIGDKLVVAGTHLAAKPGNEKAVGAVLKIMERRARLLGLDKPQETKQSTTITTIPSPPPDLLDYQTKLLAALNIAGAINLQLPDGLGALDSKHILLEADFGTKDPPG